MSHPVESTARKSTDSLEDVGISNEATLAHELLLGNWESFCGLDTGLESGSRHWGVDDQSLGQSSDENGGHFDGWTDYGVRCAAARFQKLPLVP